MNEQLRTQIEAQVRARFPYFPNMAALFTEVFVAAGEEPAATFERLAAQFVEEPALEAAFMRQGALQEVTMLLRERGWHYDPATDHWQPPEGDSKGSSTATAEER